MATLKMLPHPAAPPFCELTLTKREASFIKSVIGATSNSKTGVQLYALLDNHDIPSWSYLVAGSDCEELESAILD